MPVDITRVINWARATYDEEPDPRAMLVILDAMWSMLELVSEVRSVYIDLIAAPELYPYPPFIRPGVDPDASLATWDDDANKFYMRMNAYYAERANMARGEITGRYTAHVVAPVLYGQGYASPGQEIWSLVRSPDVATPFSLANQLEARAETMGVVDKVRDKMLGARMQFVNVVKKGARELGREGATGAADVLERRAKDLARDVGGEWAAKGGRIVSGLILGGLVLLVARYLIVRK